MSLSESSWKEASGFLSSLGYTGGVLEKPVFRDSAVQFLSLLLQKNQELNLTGAKDLETLFWKHLVDSLSLLSIPDLGHVADWGCGGGFPGVPLALARQAEGDPTPVWFVDSVGKKVRAVEEFCSALALSHTRGVVGRGEVLLSQKQLAPVRTVVMRAVAPAERAIDWLSSGIPEWILFLGPSQVADWEKMVPRLGKKKLSIHTKKSFALPHEMGERCLLRISKSST